MPFNKHGKPCGTGRHETVFKYRYSDIADMCGLKLSTVRFYAHKGKLKPSKIASVVEFVLGYREKSTF